MLSKKEYKLEDVEGNDETKNVDRIKIAIPCVGEASLQARVSPHFGRCDSYAIVTMEDGEIKNVERIMNGEHSDCAGPVRALAAKGVTLMLVEGMGMRPYLVLRELGIEVRRGIMGTVADTINSYLNGDTITLAQDSLCGHHASLNESCHQR